VRKISIVSKQPRKLAALLALLTLTACQTPSTATITADDVCLIWDPITYSSKGDSEETKAQVRENNAERTSYCLSRKTGK